MIDTHAHIDTEAFENDCREMLSNAFAEGIEAIIIPAIEEKAWQNQYALAGKYNNIFCGIGIHPHNALEVTKDTFNRLKEYMGNKKTVAIGETGLDYYYDFAPKDVQKDVFRKHLQIAKEAELPVIIHNRDSDDDLIRILKEEQNGKLRGVLHCFSGPVSMLEEAINLGFNISFTGNITFKKSTLEEIVKLAPMDKIMLETDSPYMTPVPYRGKRNDPSKLKYIAEKISEIKSINIQEVISMTTKTAKQLFNLPVLLIAFFMATTILSAQKEEYFDESDSAAIEFVNPYPKLLGITPYIGSNTIVDRQVTPAGTKSNSYDGLFSWGFGVFYTPFDFMNLQVSYMSSKSTKNSEIYKGVFPDYQNLLEITTHWSPNPYNRINVFGTLGTTLFFIESNKKPDFSYGICTGVGFNININTGAGLVAIIADWNLNFSLKTFQTGNFVKDENGETIINSVETSTFYSIPRFGVAFYPKIFN
jgi:TatD DNase family protein